MGNVGNQSHTAGWAGSHSNGLVTTEEKDDLPGILGLWGD